MLPRIPCRSCRSTAVTALMLALVAPVLAQQTVVRTPGASTPEAHAAGCRALALKQNPQVILANIEVSQSEQERQLARSALLPQVIGSVSEQVHRVNLESAIGFRFPGFAQHVGPY